MKSFKIAVCQMKVTASKTENINKAKKMIESAKKSGATMAVLPEMFICPYDTNVFPIYAEKEDDNTIDELKKLSVELDILIIAGTIPESEEKNIYNTCFIIKDGTVYGKHRKVHLFEIYIENEITFREADVLSAGSEISVFDINNIKLGIAVCFDIRFPEMIHQMYLQGMNLLIIPGAFNMSTGPAHWELLLRARAVDNQCYVVGAAPARDENASYVSYANSMIVDPWGNILCNADTEESIIITEINFELLNRIKRIWRKNNT